MAIVAFRSYVLLKNPSMGVHLTSTFCPAEIFDSFVVLLLWLEHGHWESLTWYAVTGDLDVDIAVNQSFLRR